jgi:protein SCO1/2
VAQATSIPSAVPPDPPSADGPRSRSKPAWLWAAGVLALVIVLGGGFVAWRALATPARLVGGADITNRPPAPDFTLTDQLGRTQQLSKFKGRPIALTFLYTNCPDVCPLIAANLHETYKQLGNQAKDVAILAVTVDPANDTVPQLRTFSDQRSLTDEWSFMTGPADQLDHVWQAYGILAQPVDANGRPISPVAQKQAQGVVPQPSDIEHSAPVFLIDKTGALREMLPVDFTPATLVTDFKVLLGEH